LVSAGVDETKPVFAHVSLSLSCYPIETSTLCRLQIDDISFTLEEQEVAAVSWFRARRERERERKKGFRSRRSSSSTLSSKPSPELLPSLKKLKKISTSTSPKKNKNRAWPSSA